MFVFGNLFLVLAKLVDLVLTVYIWIVIARALISWVNPDPFNPIVMFLRRATDPLLFRLRRYIPPFGTIDLSPLVLILIVWAVKIFTVSTLYDLARVLR